MTDYRSPTVVQQIIPLADMTPLEIWLLSLIFEARPSGDGLYMSSHSGPRDRITIDLADLREAFAASAGFLGTAQQIAAQALQRHGDTGGFIDIDVSLGWWDAVLQDIVKRSTTLDHVSVVMIFPCEDMHSDGLGGLAMLITAQAIRSKSLDDVLMDFLDEAEERGEIGPIA